MTPKQADKIIEQGRPVVVTNTRYQETFTATFVRRDRFSIYSSNGGVFDRQDLALVNGEILQAMEPTDRLTAIHLLIQVEIKRIGDGIRSLHDANRLIAEMEQVTGNVMLLKDAIYIKARNLVYGRIKAELEGQS